MTIALIITFSFFLLLIVLSDLKSREISTLLLILSSLAAGSFAFYKYNYIAFFQNALINISYLVFLFLFLKLYFFLKKSPGIVDSKLGLGDILFFLSLIFIFEPISFYIFLSISFILGLCYFVFYRIFLKKEPSIPLAGIAAGVSIVYNAFYLLKNVDLYQNYYYIQLIA